MKNIIGLIISFIAIAIIMMCNTSISADASYYANVTENANMRDDYYNIIYNIPAGSSVNVIGQYPYDKSRTSIEYNGVTGHILTSVLQEDAKSDSYYAYVVENANMRDDRYAKICQIPAWATVEVIGKYQYDWLRTVVKYNGVIGHILTSVLQEDAKSDSYYAYVVENANMRDDTYAMICQIPAWASVEVIGKYQYDSSRTVVKYKGQIGHVLSSVIANSQTSASFQGYYACNFYKLNMRDTLGNIICEIPPNEYMYVTGNAEDNSRVNISYNGMTGTVLKAGLQKIEDAVFVSIANQSVALFSNSQLLYTSSCVTGRDGMETPAGIHYIYSMERNRYLIGYNPDGTTYCSYVNYWMPFCGDVGLHDATWRSSFGTTNYTYSGSYGCVNLPLWMVAAIYENAYVGMPVYVS